MSTETSLIKQLITDRIAKLKDTMSSPWFDDRLMGDRYNARIQELEATLSAIKVLSTKYAFGV